MHFLVGLGILAGLVWFAFGTGPARILVGAALLVAVTFFGFIVYVAMLDGHRQSVEQPASAVPELGSPEHKAVVGRTPASDDDYSKRADREYDDQMVLNAVERALDAVRTDADRASLEDALARAASSAMNSAIVKTGELGAVQAMCRAKHIANCTYDAAVAYKK
ncbi:hypothetical protein FBZ93_11610 [Bradyrhizobium macuxiense]|uniref:Uncharacterized protein n=1 Tax=Bradyrhizobium macuxiense TaxID=1755647 RepID=A0A560L1G0_9BRAD|nr:hypothetical protein [Bradyrhizobium macuxiense]TWB89295.1 hypothetical protein FBZ93_11610 [Bradyrhizobium macuxiense]